MYCSNKQCFYDYDGVMKKFPDINLDKLKQFLKEECEMRNSPIIQELYDAVQVNFNRGEEVEDLVQQMILIRHNLEMTTHEYRTFLSYYREELKDDAFFMKHNIMTDCPLPPGQIRRKITDFSLYTLENLQAVNLNSLIDQVSDSKKTIILASSST